MRDVPAGFVLDDPPVPRAPDATGLPDGFTMNEPDPVPDGFTLDEQKASVGGVLAAGAKGLAGGVVNVATAAPGSVLPAYEIATGNERRELAAVEKEIGYLEGLQSVGRAPAKPPYLKMLFSGQEEANRLQKEAEAQARATAFSPADEARLTELKARREKVRGDLEAGQRTTEKLWGAYNDILQWSGEKFGVRPDAPESERIANLIGSGLGSLGLAVGLSFALGPQFGANVLAAQQAVSTYADQRMKGKSPEEATLKAGLDYDLTRRIEGIPLHFLTDAARNMPRVVRMLAGGAAELVTEDVQQMSSNIIRGDPLLTGIADSSIAAGASGAMVGALVPGRARVPEQGARVEIPDVGSVPKENLQTLETGAVQSAPQTEAEGINPGANQANSATGPVSTIDIGDGLKAARLAAPGDKGSGTWRLTDENSGVLLDLDWNDEQDAEVLRQLDPDENHRRVSESVAASPLGKAAGPVRVEVVRSVEELPENLRGAVAERTAEGGAEGVFVAPGSGETGPTTVYVFSDAVSPGRAPVVAVHEAVGHAGLRGVLGGKLDTTLDAIYGSNRRAAVDALGRELGLDVSTEAGRREATEELLARTAELQDRDPALWQRVVVAIRSALRDLGFGVSWSDADIAVLLQRSREYAEGRRAGAAAGDASAVATEPASTGEVDLFGEPIVAREPGQPTTALADYAVIEVPVEEISLSKDVPNFKRDADERGVVTGNELKGKYQRLGTAPIVVWERLDGRKEVITGRHRLDLARRTGEKTIPAQVVMEADGFTAAMALGFDAEANIRDNQGGVFDYATYFKNSDISEEEASGRGLLSRDKGRKGFYIGKYAEDDLYAVFADGKITADKAAAIAQAAPGNAELQGVVLRYALEDARRSADDLANYAMAIQAIAPGASATQIDLFGRNEAWQIEADKMTKAATGLKNDLVAERQALNAAGKLGREKFKQFRKQYGIDPGDPAAIEARKVAVEQAIERMGRWPTDPELTALVRRKAGLVADEAVVRLSRARRDAPHAFSLIGETVEEANAERDQRRARERSAIQQQRAAPRQLGFLDTTGDLFDQRDAENPLFAIPTPAVRLSRSPAQRRADLLRSARAVAERENEGKKLRGTVERLAPSSLLTHEQAVGLVKRPESWHEGQHYDEINARLRLMKPEDLVFAMHRNPLMGGKDADNIAALAAGELLNRKINAGEDPSDLLSELSKMSTVWAQLLRQMAEIKGARPESMVWVLQKGLEKVGYTVQPAKLDAINRAAADVFSTTATLRAAQREANRLPVPGAVKAVEAAERAAYLARREWLMHARDVAPPSLSKTITTMLRGNLLTPMSQVRNVVGNALFAPLRVSADAIGATLDALDSLVTGRQRALLNPLTGSLEGTKAAGRALKRVATEFFTGPVSDEVQGETVAGFRPLRALAQVFTPDGRASLPVNAKTGRVDLKTYGLKLVEGTLGIPPEAMLRALRFADDPLREFQAARTSVEFREIRRRLGEARGLRGDDLDRFANTLDPEALKTIDREARSAVFQQDNIMTTMIHSLGRVAERVSPAMKPWMDVAGATAMPYVKTPTNLMVEGTKYAVPEFSLARAVYFLGTGNRREGYRAIGQAIMGYSMHAAAAWLVKNGLASGDPDRDRNGLRALQYWLGANVVNVSAAKRRYDTGQQQAWNEGDDVRSYRDFGFFGLILQMHANRQFKRAMKDWDRVARLGLPPEESSDILNALAPSATAPLETLAAVMKMSTLKGTADLLNALMEPGDGAARWWNGFSETMTAGLGIPNTLKVLGNVRWDYLPDPRVYLDTPADAAAQFANAVKVRLWNRDFPLRRGLFGEPIQTTPEGSDPVAYHLYDFTKGRTIARSPRYNAVLSAWAATGDSAAIPAEPNREVLNERTGKWMKLNRRQHARFIELVGKFRGANVDILIHNTDFYERNPADRVKMLRQAYDNGREKAERVFFAEMSDPSAARRFPPHWQAIIAGP